MSHSRTVRQLGPAVVVIALVVAGIVWYRHDAGQPVSAGASPTFDCVARLGTTCDEFAKLTGQSVQDLVDRENAAIATCQAEGRGKCEVPPETPEVPLLQRGGDLPGQAVPEESWGPVAGATKALVQELDCDLIVVDPAGVGDPDSRSKQMDAIEARVVQRLGEIYDPSVREKVIQQWKSIVLAGMRAGLSPLRSACRIADFKTIAMAADGPDVYVKFAVAEQAKVIPGDTKVQIDDAKPDAWFPDDPGMTTQVYHLRTDGKTWRVLESANVAQPGDGPAN